MEIKLQTDSDSHQLSSMCWLEEKKKKITQIINRYEYCCVPPVTYKKTKIIISLSNNTQLIPVSSEYTFFAERTCVQNCIRI